MTESERQEASERYYSELRKKLDERIRSDQQLDSIAKKIADKKADFKDTAKYSEIVSDHIAAVLQENVGEINSPLGKEYVCKELLKDQYSAINEVLGKVQVSVDEKNGIHIKPQKAPFPEERVTKVAHSLEDPTKPPETIKRRAGAPVANVSKSFHDDYIEENAKFRSKAGLKCYITRTTDGKCCEWCTKVAGRYEFGSQPEDIFRRHDNCNCMIDYDGQRLRGELIAGKRGKKWVEVPNEGSGAEPPKVFTKEEAQALNEEKKPVVFTPEQAKELNNEKVSEIFVNKPSTVSKTEIVYNQSIDKSTENGIIEETEDTREFEPLSSEKVVPVLRKDSEEWINNLSSEEVRAVKKYTKNSGDLDDDKFFARLNSMLRGDIPKNDTLKYYSDTISEAISRFELEHDIICYRSVGFNPVEGLKVGDVYKPKQFLSSSVSKSGTLNGKYILEILTPKGSKGAYIELLSKYPKQREFLFDKDSVYNILAINGNIITLEAIV